MFKWFKRKSRFLISHEYMSRAELIRYLLKRSGKNQSDIARELKVSPAAVTLTIDGKLYSEKIQKCIAKNIGFKAEDLFGSN
ncbi:MAG: hypothetical protein JW984_15055 [Deltaproteobacteria bacterium]|uniref:Uncharacterized protein n=1 Tax=Candidatus Zymogenus saltonus TaxID=2844893 RepID=A0A9D8KIU5_9DELT|nr:hypothetical protein [Candidatus Zymogenus saltonus]